MADLLTLTRPNVTPPGGWRWTDPNTLAVLRADTLAELVKAAVAHRKANKLDPIPDLMAVVMDQICRQVPASLCHATSSNVVGSFRANPGAPGNTGNVARFSLSTSISKTLVLVRNNAGRVSQAEAEKRAGICVVCPMNTQEQVCYSCSVKSTMDQWLGGSRTTGVDHQLALCGIDGTFSKVSVHVKAEPNQKKLGGYPDGCWKRESESAEG